jgi:hypothetical protein
MRKLYPWFMLLVLIVSAGAQGFFLFQQWTKIPRQDLSYWRIEYATLALDDDHEHVLHFQTRVESPTTFKNNQIPHLEVLLTDVFGNTLASRNFPPNEWLSSDVLNKREWLMYGVPSQTEITVTLPLEIPAAASGFQVHLIYR